MTINRRTFIKAAGAVTLGFAGLSALLRQANGDDLAALMADGYGELIPDAKGMLDLPNGFAYKVISRQEQPMADGLVVPGVADGMAAFPGGPGRTILVRNHELMPDDVNAFGRDLSLIKNINPDKMYDFGEGKTPCTGGTTNLVYNHETGEVEREFLSLCGTLRNCAGGVTPWGTWITCEELVITKGYYPDWQFTAEKDHGYNFEVPATADIGMADPVPLRAMGRFNHEAVAVDPKTGIVYQTEDRPDGLIYRFIPDQPGDLSAGKLQALAVVRKPTLDTRNWDAEAVAVGESMGCEWIDLEDVDAPADDLRYRGATAGAAVFARGEGMWYGRGEIYYSCTNGGKKQYGQIWKYTPSPAEGQPGEGASPGTLELFLESTSSRLVKSADNVLVSPWGDLILCEDRGGAEVRLIGVTPSGKCYTFARHHLKCEFAGACFSPDGSTMFVNIQDPGLTLAITGPWV